jgi:hypothetical protein
MVTSYVTDNGRSMAVLQSETMLEGGYYVPTHSFDWNCIDLCVSNILVNISS